LFYYCTINDKNKQHIKVTQIATIWKR